MVTRMDRRAYSQDLTDHFSGLHVSLGESISVPHPLSPVRRRHGVHTRSVSDSTQFSTSSFVSKLPPAVANIPKDDIRGYMHSKRVTSYLVGNTLGQGSFAKVKEAFHVLVGEKVAMKVIDKKKALQDSYVSKNLRREAKLLQMVRHPNILQLLEIIETDNSYYLITELCSGGELMKHIYDKTRLEEEEARKYMRQIVSAVDHLHRAGIIHRDLKVENLLLDSNMDLKIIDFGLSNQEFTEGEQGQIVHCTTQCGSPAYAAPELLGYKKYGPEVDIWSIGVNMYAMLTGCLPYTVEPFNITTLHAKMLENKMNPIPEHLSEGCKDLLRRLLISNPEKRIKMPEIMAHPWMNKGHSVLFGPAPYPNPLAPSDINEDIVEHMVRILGSKDSEEELRQELLANRSTSASAVYHLLTARLARYQRQFQTKTTRVRRRSKRLSQDQGYFEPEGEDDDAKSTISCPTRSRATSHGSRPQRPSHAPLRRKNLGRILPNSEGDLPVHIEEEEPSAPRRSRLHQRRRTLPPTVLEGDLSAFQQRREDEVAVPHKTSTLPRRKKSQERQQRDMSPPLDPYEFDMPHRPETHLAPIRHPPTIPRNSYSQPKELFQLRQNIRDQLHLPPSHTTPAWHSTPSSRNTSRQPSRAGSRNPSTVTSQNSSNSSFGHPPPPHHIPSSSELTDLDNMDDIQFHQVNSSYTTKVSPKHAGVIFQLHSPEEDVSAGLHFPTISHSSNRARRRSPEGEVNKAPHHRTNGFLHHPGEFRIKTDLGMDAIKSEIIRAASNLKMREFEEGARNSVICLWKGIRFSITVAKEKRNGTCHLNFQWLSGGDHKSYTDICKKMMDSIVIVIGS